MALSIPIMKILFRKLSDHFPPEGEEEQEAEWEPVKAVALFDFRKERPDDLEFQKGNMILVLSKPFPGWWEGEILEGRMQGTRGLFPENYVEIDPAKIEEVLEDSKMPALPTPTSPASFPVGPTGHPVRRTIPGMRF